MLEIATIVCPRYDKFSSRDSTSKNKIRVIAEEWDKVISGIDFRSVVSIAEDLLADELFKCQNKYISCLPAADRNLFLSMIIEGKEDYIERTAKCADQESMKEAVNRYKVKNRKDVSDAREYAGARQATMYSRLKYITSKHLLKCGVVFYFNLGKEYNLCNLPDMEEIGNGRCILNINMLTGIAYCSLGGVPLDTEMVVKMLGDVNVGTL